MLSFFQGNLSRTSQRYLSYYQGKGDKKTVVKIFNNCVTTQLIIAVALCGILLLCTPLVFRFLLNIDPSRLDTAKIVYLLAVGMLFFNLLSTPYLAALISRENIVYSSIIQIFDAFLKIPIAISLIYISGDKLTWYSIMTFSVCVLNTLCYYAYCRLKYYECKEFSFKSFDFAIFKDMFSFMGWNIYGTLCVTGRTQGIALLLNNFFTVAINSAYGIANQLMSQLSFISNALTIAMNPRIIKSEGAGDRQKMLRLTEISCKFSFLLLSIIIIPAVLHMDTILEIWLKNVPDYTSMFCKFILISALADQLTVNLAAANHAVGNVKQFNLRLYTIKIITLPVAYVLLKLHMPVYYVMIDYLVFEIICATARVVFIHQTIGLSIRGYLKNVLVSVVPSLLANIAVCLVVFRYFGGWWCLLTFVVSALITVVATILFGLKEDEKVILKSLVSEIRRKAVSK